MVRWCARGEDLENKDRINSWNRMTTKLRGKILPKDYKLILFRKIQNLKQRSMTVREYIKEFYKVNIRSGLYGRHT